MRNLLYATIILLFMLISSCDIETPVETGNDDPVETDNDDPVETDDEETIEPGDLIPREEGEDWFLRDISGTAENTILTYFSLNRSTVNSMELSFEQYKAEDENAKRFDFTFRYYFLVEISIQDDEHTADITGIKTGRYDSYTVPGDTGFTDILRDAGLEDFQLDFNEADSTINILTDTGRTYNLQPSYNYKKTIEESLVHDGEMRDGEYTENFYYSPMGDEFRLYTSYYFTYRTDEGGVTTISNNFDTYGERIQDTDTYQCEITQFSNRAYPRAFYSDSYISAKFESFIESLGFFQFSEQSEAKEITLSFDNLETADTSYTLKRSPIRSE